MGGVCIALYGFIAVSGLKMLQGVDLGDNRNLFVVSTILIAGVGGFAMTFVLPNAAGSITLTEVACALILGIIVNVVVNLGKKNYELFKMADIGDIVGVSGVMNLTRTGELTIKAKKVHTLNKVFASITRKVPWLN